MKLQMAFRALRSRYCLPKAIAYRIARLALVENLSVHDAYVRSAAECKCSECVGDVIDGRTLEVTRG